MRTVQCCSINISHYVLQGCPGGSVVKNTPAKQETQETWVRSIPGLGRSPGEGNGNPFQYPCLVNPMDWGAWQASPWGHNSQLGLSDQAAAALPTWTSLCCAWQERCKQERPKLEVHGLSPNGIFLNSSSNCMYEVISTIANENFIFQAECFYQVQVLGTV